MVSALSALKKNDWIANNNRTEISVDSPEPPANPEETEKKERKKHSGRNPLPAHLPREEIIHDLSPQEKSCGHCGALPEPNRRRRKGTAGNRLDSVHCEETQAFEVCL